jgi:dihydrofolate synthase/folylpolyglutamate synthase
VAADAYAAALARLFALTRRGVELDLARPRRVARALGDPQDAVPVVHVGGTNGKGSTAAMIEAVLRAAGLRTGLYTSPHLCRFTERIRLGGVEISQEELLLRLGEVEEAAAGEALTFFEVATLLALRCFAAAKLDVAVLEVGLGGRLDATNLSRAPRCAVVCGVALDHQEWLGDRLADIAREKAGIFKAGRPAVVALPDDPDARDALSDGAAAARAPLLVRGRDFDLAAGTYHGPGGALADVRVGLPGRHQIGNAALALAAVGASGLRVDDEARRAGLAEVRWPGRLERLAGDPPVVLDCAHNPDAARALAQALFDQGERPRVLLFGALADKDAWGMLEALAPLFSGSFLCAPPSPRAADPQALAAMAQKLGHAECIVDAERALAAARDAARAQGATLCVAGSTYLVGRVRSVLLGEPSDPVPLADPLGDRPGVGRPPTRADS